MAEPNAFAMDATIAAFTRGGDWVDALRGYLADNKREARRMIDKYNAAASSDAHVRLVSGLATYLMWLDCSAFTHAAGDGRPGRFADTDELCEYLRREHAVRFSPGAQFGGNGRDFIRINVACPRSRMGEGIRRLLAGLAAAL
ncbi:hypothetical protein [Bifidobacterium sp. SO4]|uniref:hypothetical protein n=1 Tax=Bifidobacterium sp. SO4 TaxID=2809030 RepID=UPI001C2F1456|nr:hypothetical protein [Bifidobacterium sp. SO4]